MTRFEIAEPTVEQLFQRAIDQAGYHDADSIPIAEARQLFVSFFNYQFQRNQQIQKALDNYRNLSPMPPIAVCRECDLPLDGFYQKHTPTGFSMVCSKCAIPSSSPAPVPPEKS